MSLTRDLGKGWGLRIQGGRVTRGLLALDEEEHELTPGWMGGLQGSKRWRDSDGWKPWVMNTLSFSASSLGTREGYGEPSATFTATDLRLGVSAGYTLWNAISPYLSARVFGGPILWARDDTSVMGTDKYHYQLAAGLTGFLPGGLFAYVDASPLGERSVSAGAGMAF